MRLRWITGLKLSEPVWFSIGLGLFIIGLLVIAYPFIHWWQHGVPPRGRRSGPALMTAGAAIFGGTLLRIGLVEIAEAVRNMRLK